MKIFSRYTVFLFIADLYSNHATKNVTSHKTQGPHSHPDRAQLNRARQHQHNTDTGAIGNLTTGIHDFKSPPLCESDETIYLFLFEDCGSLVSVEGISEYITQYYGK